MTKRIFDVRVNWDLFVPFLNDKEVMQSLAECLGYPSVEEWKVNGFAPPWAHTSSDYWFCKIDDLIDEDKDFQQEVSFLNDEEEELYFNIRDSYRERYEPKQDTYEWYQWKHHCHDIAPFMVTLVKKSIEEAKHVWILKSSGHSIVRFECGKDEYYVDLLNEWSSVEDLEHFMDTSESY